VCVCVFECVFVCVTHTQTHTLSLSFSLSLSLSLSLSSGVHQGTDVEENEVEDMREEEEYAYTSKESTWTCCKLNKEKTHLPIAKRSALRVPALRSPAQSASSSMCGALRTHSRALRVPALSTLAQSASPTDKIEPVKFKVGEDVEACHKVP